MRLLTTIREVVLVSPHSSPNTSTTTITSTITVSYSTQDIIPCSGGEGGGEWNGLQCWYMYIILQSAQFTVKGSNINYTCMHE